MTTMSSPQAELPPPSSEVGVLGWLRHNLFSGWLSGLTTIALGAVLLVALWLLLQWAVSARWGVITDNMRLLLVGRYPPEQIWRVWAALLVTSVVVGASAGTWRSAALRTMAIMLAAGQLALALLIVISDMGMVGAVALVADAAVLLVAMIVTGRRPLPRWSLLIGWLASVVLVFFLLNGLSDEPLLPEVSTGLWGGLLLTILLSVISILLSFPIGVALALGRRSKLPVVRVLSTAYIELVRAVPLITILYMGFLVLPLFLGGWDIDNVWRAIGGMTIFSAAYIAENVRGGLQAIPSGQVEAAEAVGLRSWQVNAYIVLPQALRVTIPANVGQFISLLKDTTLVVIIGLLELLGVGRAILAQPEWLGANFEVYVFVATVFFVLCYALSQASYRLEKELGIGER